MRMYGAFVLAILALIVRPFHDIEDVPFAELTLGKLGQSLLYGVLAFWAIYAVICSLQRDTFWPWRWTKRIVIILAARAGMLLVLAGACWAIAESPKLNDLALEYPIITAILLFFVITGIVMMDDDDILPLKPHEDQKPAIE